MRREIGREGEGRRKICIEKWRKEKDREKRRETSGEKRRSESCNERRRNRGMKETEERKW